MWLPKFLLVDIPFVPPSFLGFIIVGRERIELSSTMYIRKTMKNTYAIDAVPLWLSSPQVGFTADLECELILLLKELATSEI